MLLGLYCNLQNIYANLNCKTTTTAIKKDEKNKLENIQSTQYRVKSYTFKAFNS